MTWFVSLWGHGRLRRLLSSYIDEKASEAERRALERHLSGCEACRWELESLRATAGLLRDVLPLETPRSFVLTEAPAPLPYSPPYVRAVGVATSVAAVLLIALLAGDLTGALSQSGPGIPKLEPPPPFELQVPATTEPAEGLAEVAGAAEEEAPTVEPAPPQEETQPAPTAPLGGAGTTDVGLPRFLTPTPKPEPTPTATPEPTPTATPEPRPTPILEPTPQPPAEEPPASALAPIEVPGSDGGGGDAATVAA